MLMETTTSIFDPQQNIETITTYRLPSSRKKKRSQPHNLVVVENLDQLANIYLPDHESEMAVIKAILPPELAAQLPAEQDRIKHLDRSSETSATQDKQIHTGPHDQLPIRVQIPAGLADRAIETLEDRKYSVATVRYQFKAPLIPRDSGAPPEPVVPKNGFQPAIFPIVDKHLRAQFRAVNRTEQFAIVSSICSLFPYSRTLVLSRSAKNIKRAFSFLQSRHEAVNNERKYQLPVRTDRQLVCSTISTSYQLDAWKWDVLILLDVPKAKSGNEYDGFDDLYGLRTHRAYGVLEKTTQTSSLEAFLFEGLCGPVRPKPTSSRQSSPKGKPTGRVTVKWKNAKLAADHSSHSRPQDYSLEPDWLQLVTSSVRQQLGALGQTLVLSSTNQQAAELQRLLRCPVLLPESAGSHRRQGTDNILSLFQFPEHRRAEFIEALQGGLEKLAILSPSVQLSVSLPHLRCIVRADGLWCHRTNQEILSLIRAIHSKENDIEIFDFKAKSGPVADTTKERTKAYRQAGFMK